MNHVGAWPYNKVAELTEQLRADGHEIKRLDLGGGLGIPYARSNEAPPLPSALGGEPAPPQPPVTETTERYQMPSAIAAKPTTVDE